MGYIQLPEDSVGNQQKKKNKSDKDIIFINQIRWIQLEYEHTRVLDSFLFIFEGLFLRLLSMSNVLWLNIR